MSVRTRTTTAGPVIEVSGELDHHTAPRIRELLPRLPIEEGQQLVLDLGGLTFCDSSGITVLIAARNHALSTRATIALAAVPDQVRRIFTVIGLQEVFPLYPSAQAAEASWTPPAL
jgi:anti-sigma B factor antagonist